MSVILGPSPGGTVLPVLPAPPQAPPQRVLDDFEVVSAGGRVSLLAGDSRLLLDGTSGLTGSDNEVELLEIAGVDGGIVRGVNDEQAGLSVSPLDPVLVVTVTGEDSFHAEGIVSEIRGLLSSRRWGLAELVVTRGDGEVFRLTVQHVPVRGDFDPPQGPNSRVRTITLRLFAQQPYWRGRPGVVGPWVIGGGVPLRLPSRLGFHLARSSLLGRPNTFDVAGDEMTAPVVRVVGAVGSITATRLTRALPETYTVAAALGAGEVMTIDHSTLALFRGGQIIGPGGESWDDRLGDDGSELWRLNTGEETVQFDLVGAGQGATVSMTWDTLHWAPWS